MWIRIVIVAITLSMAFGSVIASMGCAPAQDQEVSAAAYPSKRMADGKEWTARNLDVDTEASSCYDDAESNCRQYGRLYPWDAAREACQGLGDGWRLPTDEEWRRLAKSYGGVSEDAADKGKAAYEALLSGGGSGFEALLGGGSAEDGQYARVEAHGFYWTSSEIDAATAWCYNFGRGGFALHRQSGLEKQRAISVRCVRD